MRTKRILIFGMLALAMIGRAQITDPGWYNVPQRDSSEAMSPDNPSDVPAPKSKFKPEIAVNFTSPAPLLTSPAGTSLAETVTPDIQMLANNLGNDPLRIYNYVHDHIRHVLYFGAKKGAELTLLEKSGNDFDQSALLVALLRAAGFTNSPGSNGGVGYQFGWEGIPYDSTDNSHRDLHHWLQLNLTNSNWNYTSNYLINLYYGIRGYPTYTFVAGNTNLFLFQRVWVTLTLNNTYYYLDPAFKVSEPVSGIANLPTAMGFSSNGVMSAAAGTVSGSAVSGLQETALKGTLTSYATNFLNYLQSNAPNASVAQILGGWQIVPLTNNSMPTNLGFQYYTFAAYPAMNPTNWSYIPTNVATTLRISFANTSRQFFMPELQGQRLALTYDSSGAAQLWQDDALLTSGTTSGSSDNVSFYLNLPIGNWNFNNNTLTDTSFNDLNVTNAYQRTNATYALTYAFEPDNGWLQKRQSQLDSYRAQGLSDSSRQVVSETLNIMGLSWMLQTEAAGNLIEPQLGILPQFHCRLGRMAQEAGHGYYIDVYAQEAGFFSAGGYDGSYKTNFTRDFDLFTYFSSALEESIIEQFQNTGIAGASTVKMLQVANSNSQSVYLANSANWTTVRSSLTGYPSANLDSINSRYIATGNSVLLPQNGANHIAGAGSWSGYGYIASSPGSLAAFTISGNYQGGYSSTSGGAVSPPYASQVEDSQAQALTQTPILTPSPTGADPVDMANGTFQVEHTDLSIGQAEPKGITLSRFYNSARRFINPAGLAPGWTHNYSISAMSAPAPQAALGETTPAQAATMIVATCAAVGTYNNTLPNVKNWMVTALIAKWGIDQLTQGGVSVALGKDTVQFIKQPNGTFTPPANCTMTLTQSNSAYSLQMRHGNRFNFTSAGLLTNIIDQYNNVLTATFNASNQISTVKDWKNRTLTFNYSGGQLASVTDSAGRTVSYGHTQSDLTSFTDAEQKTSTYTYSTNHEITATFDALNRLVVSNLYDGSGHVTTQLTQGDTNKIWRIFWTGGQTIEQDPAGGQRIFYFDDQGRHIGLLDQLGNFSQTVYDGQNHIIATISPLNETNQFLFDGNNNLIKTIDSLGYTNQFIFDNQNNLTKAIDPRGNPMTYGYNAQFSLTGQTNSAGDYLNFAFNTDGTLYSRTDAGGATIHGYDGNGVLNSITYPGGLGTENFVNNNIGDPTSHTDGNGNSTTFQFNARRELTNTIAPTNLTVKVTLDAVGNVATTTDARGNSASNSWSATRHLVKTTLPTTTQGTPIVTNFYDSRDWLVKTVDPLQNSTLYTNDVAGRAISVTDPLLRTTRFVLDADGRNLATVNAGNETNGQTFDNRGGLLKQTDGAGHFSTRGYDAAGNQITFTNRNAKKWQFQFDGANRLTNTLTPLNRSSSVIFNHQGLPATLKDPASQTTSLYYDAKGRLTNRTDNVGSTFYRLDPNGNQTNVAENGQTNSWAFDAYNRVSSYRDADGNLIQYRFDASGNLTNLIYPGGKNVYYAFDSNNHLTNVTDWSNRKTAITYDLNGRMTGVTRPNGTYRTVQYDAAGQATNILEQMANTLPIAWFKFNWTNTGTMAWEFAAPLPRPVTIPTRTMTYDDDNRLATVNGSSVVNDSDGNLISGPLTNSTLFISAYDARNRLLNVGGVTNFYDALNNRISQNQGTNRTKFVVDPNAKLPQVLIRAKNGVTNYYIYGAGLLYQITETATATNTRTYHYDYRGSTVALTDDNGNVTDRVQYSAYGMTAYRSGTTDTPFLFNGKYGVQTDPNGLLYMRARFYSPYLCRFLNPDPTGFAGGMNFYAYANGNPVSLIDPFGLLAWSDVGDYFTGVGQVFAGYGLAARDTAVGLYNVGRHPINTLDGLANVAAHPVLAYNAISESVANTWNSGLTGQGEIVGNVLIAAASLGATKATSIAGRSSELVDVTRWGRPGLGAGDWVMQGGKTPLNYRLSGKWQNGFGNEFAPFEAGETFSVPRGDIYSPSGLNPFDGRLKSLVPGQMRYYPDGMGLLTTGEAGALMFGTAAGNNSSK